MVLESSIQTIARYQSAAIKMKSIMIIHGTDWWHRLVLPIQVTAGTSYLVQFLQTPDTGQGTKEEWSYVREFLAYGQQPLPRVAVDSVQQPLSAQTVRNDDLKWGTAWFRQSKRQSLVAELIVCYVTFDTDKACQMQN